MTEPLAAHSRIFWIDTAKGAGIVLVVIGHVCVSAAGGLLSWFIFLFHMPFFFIIAGLLSRAEPFPRCVGKRARALLIPYAAFLVVLGGVMIAKDQLAGAQLGNDLLKLAYGGDRLGGYLGVFWFVTCLFMAQIVFNRLLAWSHTVFGAGMLSAAAACLLAASLLNGHPGPLAIGVVPFAVVLLWTGCAYAALPTRTWPVLLASALFASALLGASGRVSFHLDMKHGDYGPPVAGALLAIALSLVMLEICKGLDRIAVIGPLLRWAGRGSLLIMFLHQPVHFALGRLGLPEPVIAVAALGVPMFAFEIARRSRPLSTVFLGFPSRRTRPFTPAIELTELRVS